MINKLQTSKTITLLSLVAGLFFIASCGTDSDQAMGTLEVRMYDAPIDSADEVNVSVQRVEINETGSETGWSVISEPNTTYNLLDLRNGAYEVLGDTTLPVGTYQQIRLILNETGHTVVVDGQIYDMKVPSGAQTGVKLNVNADIEENITYVLLLDFDASRSVVQAGQNNPGVDYLLQPVIKATNQAVTGAISGTVDPVDSIPVVYAIQNSDTLASTIADTASGEFDLIGLEGGTYTVSFDPRNGDYQVTDTTGVEVTVGETNDLGTVTIDQSSTL